MANEDHARLVYLSRVLAALEMLLRVGAECIDQQKCDAFADELEPAVRDIAARMEARIPELIPLRALEYDDRDEGIERLVEIEMRCVKEELARVDKVKAAFGAKRL